MNAELFEQIYESMARNETVYDGRYYTGVKTTGIVCRPSCRARTPKRENVVFYDSFREALAEGFRPCKRCRPEEPGGHGPDAALAARVDELIREWLGEPLTLGMLGEALAVSPFHLQRIYKRAKGCTPAERHLRERLETARRLLKEQAVPIAEIGRAVGFRSASHFAVWFRKNTGTTPTAYREEDAESKA